MNLARAVAWSAWGPCPTVQSGLYPGRLTTFVNAPLVTIGVSGAVEMTYVYLYSWPIIVSEVW